MPELFEAITDPDAIRRERLVKRLFVGALVAFLTAGFLYWEFKNYAQERQVKHFFQALKANDLRRAYDIWKPTSSYTFAEFQKDWGPNSEFGSIQDYKIVASRSRGSDVAVTARVNGRETTIWVRRSDKSLSFPPW